MIREYIKKHDQFSLEIKLEFPASAERRKKNNYFVNMYLFLPRALDVNKHNFTKQDFYNSLKTNIRLTTPPYSLQNIIDGKNSPFTKLKESIANYTAAPDAERKDDFELQLKRICSIIGTALRRESNRILQSTNLDNCTRLTDEYLLYTGNIHRHFSNLEKEVHPPLKNNGMYELYRFADEYQSLLIERSLFELHDKLLRKNAECSAEIKDKLEETVLRGMAYREKKAYPSVAYTGHSNDNVLHRASRLKKFIESNLFLNTDTKKDGIVFEQFLFALAAGLAMVFATAVAFASQMIYGSLTLPFFIALVISYMFKDRIKELVRIYLNKHQHKFAQDFKTNIYDQRLKKIGYLKESFNFVQHKNIQQTILQARDSTRATDITKESMGEKIILYRNQIRVFNKKVKSLHDFSGTTEILRLHIADFTKNMDDPEKELFIKRKKGLKRGFARRFYHLNLILNYSDGKEEKIKLYKLIMARNGINRIERHRYNNKQILTKKEQHI